MTSPGMSIHSSVETSCMISASGNSGARRSGVTGSFVPGCSGGSSWMPACAITGNRFCHAVGMSVVGRSKRVRSVIGASSGQQVREAYPDALAVRQRGRGPQASGTTGWARLE